MQSKELRACLGITDEEVKQETETALRNSYKYFDVEIPASTIYTIHEAASRLSAGLGKKGTYFSHLFWYVIWPQHVDEARKLVREDGSLATYEFNPKQEKALRYLNGVCRFLIGCSLGGSTDVSDDHRSTPGWISLCLAAGLDPKTATKWQVGGFYGGSADVSEEHRSTPGWISLCLAAGLDPKTATKWQVGGFYGGSSDVSDKHRSTPGWIALCAAADLDPKTATKWQVSGFYAGSSDVSDKHRSTPGWIALCAAADLDPKTATKWQVAGKLYIFFQSLFV